MIKIFPIKPRPFRAKVFTQEIHQELRNQGQIAKRMLEKTVDTWSNKPRFRVDFYTRGEESGVQVSTKDKRFLWLDKGTQVRWAVMSSDFRPKTTVRTLGSRRGAGRVIIRGKTAMTARNIAPRPGIEARHFSEEVAKRRNPHFIKAMTKAMARGIRKARQ